MKICTLPGRVTRFYRTEVIWLLGLVHTYPDIFENGDFFSLFFEKYASKCSLLESFLSVHMKARKRWTYDSIPFRACAMKLSHSKTFVYVRPHENDKPAFTKTPLWGPIENPRFWYPKTWTESRTEKKSLFLKISRDVRTGSVFLYLPEAISLALASKSVSQSFAAWILNLSASSGTVIIVWCNAPVTSQGFSRNQCMAVAENTKFIDWGGRHWL